MDDTPNDQFERYYAEKLWELIPPIYRHEDGIADHPDVLRSFIEVLAAQAAIMRRSHDRLWEDQFIDLCDDWAVPYLGELLGTRLVSALDPRGRRVDVAKTIYYRRRAGTPAVLEELIADITGWEGAVVEEFRRLLRSPHRLDPAPVVTGRITATPAHGLPDLRRPRGAHLTGGWEEFHHLPDMRRNRGGQDGRYGVSKLAFHLFRLLAFPLSDVTPHLLAPDAAGEQRFTFDPSGRAIPLFQRHSRPSFEFQWRPALEWELPAPIRCEVLGHAEYEVSNALILQWLGPLALSATDAERLRSIRGVRFADESRLRGRLAALFPVALGAAALHRILADSLVADCGKAVLLPASGPAAAPGASLSVAVPVAGKSTVIARELTCAGNLSEGIVTPVDKTLVIDAENGLGYVTSGALDSQATVSFHYGFQGNVGAGSFDRKGLAAVLPATAGSELKGGGKLPAPSSTDPDTITQLADNRSYGPATDFSVSASAVIQAANGTRPYLELNGDWTISAGRPDSTLTLDGLWIGARAPIQVRLTAAAGMGFKQVVLRYMTLDPGGLDADGKALGPVGLSIETRIDELIIESCILASIGATAQGLAEQVFISDSILHASGATNALALKRGSIKMRRCTILGTIAAHTLEASEVLATGLITVADEQSGCMRFSAYPQSSSVPHPYRCQPLRDSPSLFTSRRFGDAGYTQLSDVAPLSIRSGGEDGSEIGVWNSLHTPIKLDSLRAKVDEFLPFGLIPLFITET